MEADVTIPKTKISSVDGHDQLTCFEIMHLPQNDKLWFRYDTDEKQCRRVCKTHPTFLECRAIVEQGLPRRSGRNQQVGRQTTRAIHEHHMRKQVQRMTPIQEEIYMEDSSVVSSLASGSQATTVTHISS